MLAAQRRHRAQHTAAGEAAAAQVAACLDSLQAEAQVRLGTCQHYTPCPVQEHLPCISCHEHAEKVLAMLTMEYTVC